MNSDPDHLLALLLDFSCHFPVSIYSILSPFFSYPVLCHVTSYHVMSMTQDQRRQLVVNHERYMEEVSRDLEHRLQSDRDARMREEKAKKDIGR